MDGQGNKDVFRACVAIERGRAVDADGERAEDDNPRQDVQAEIRPVGTILGAGARTDDPRVSHKP
jgi:hypothetical protein